MSHEPQRILVIRFSSMGDVILTTPALEALSRHFPEARIDYLTKRGFASLLDGDPRVGDVLALEAGATVGDIRAALADRDYDLVVDLHANLRSRHLLRELPRTPWVRYRKNPLARRILVWTGYRHDSLRLHTVDRYLAALPLPTDGRIPRAPSLRLTREERSAGRALLTHYGIEADSPVVAIAPMARWPTKSWPRERFAGVARRLGVTRGAQILWIGGQGETDVLRAMAEGLPFESAVVSEPNLRKLGAMLSHVDLTITNDSGPMHLACASGAPTLAIFGATTTDLGFAPLGRHVKIVETLGLKCRPCSLHGSARCPEGHFRCMLAIEEHDVYAHAQEMLLEREERMSQSEGAADAR